jgi:hypothetical protein
MGRERFNADRSRHELPAALAAEILRMEGAAFERWRRRSPWPSIDDPGAVERTCREFGPTPYYQWSLALLKVGIPKALHLLLGERYGAGSLDLSTGPDSPTAHHLRLAVQRHPTAWLLAPKERAVNGSERLILERVRDAPWPASGEDLATVLVLMLPYFQPPLDLALPRQAEIPRALYAARQQMEIATSPAPDTIGKLEAERWAAAVRDRADAAVATARTAMAKADLPEESTTFLLKWARCEIPIEETP